MDCFGLCETKKKTNIYDEFRVVYNKAKTLVIETQTSDHVSFQRKTPVILDCGSSKTKAGFVGNEIPLFTIPTVIGTSVSDDSIKKVFGMAALKSSSSYKLSYPVEQGFIRDWHDAEDLLEYVIEKCLDIQPTMHQVMVVQPLNNSFQNQEKIAEMMFEKFNFNSFQLVPSTPMGLLGSDGKTGIVVESGAGQTLIVAVENGIYVRESLRQIPIGGNDLSKYMGQLLIQSDNAKYFKGKRNELEILNEIKEIGCHVVVNYEEEIRKLQINPDFVPNNAVLRDGTMIGMRAEAFQVPELLFKPELINVQTGGIPRNIYECIETCDAGLRAELYGNICLCGGSTMFDGIVDRLLWEVKTFAGPNVNVRINAPSNRDQTVFLGASFLGACPKFRDILISSQEYHDFGPQMLHWRFI